MHRINGQFAPIVIFQRIQQSGHRLKYKTRDRLNASVSRHFRCPLASLKNTLSQPTLTSRAADPASGGRARAERRVADRQDGRSPVRSSSVNVLPPRAPRPPGWRTSPPQRTALRRPRSGPAAPCRARHARARGGSPAHSLSAKLVPSRSRPVSCTGTNGSGAGQPASASAQAARTARPPWARVVMDRRELHRHEDTSGTAGPAPAELLARRQ
jgi:hypothetical protein